MRRAAFLIVAIFLALGPIRSDAQSAPPAHAQVADPSAPQGGNIDIVSDSMTVMTNTHVAIATGHVHARGSTFEAFCDHGEVTYGESERGKRTIEVMVMHDHVRIHRFSDDLVTQSALATYTATTRDMVMTGGDPTATRGPDVLHGEVITVNLESNSMRATQPRAEMMRSNRPDPLHVDGELLTSADSGKHVRFEHSVHIYDATMDATCDRLDADVENPGESEGAKIGRMVLLGHVIGHRLDEAAWAGRALYIGDSGDWTLTEHPVVVQNGDRITGEKIVVDGPTGRAHSYNAKATFLEAPAADGGRKNEPDAGMYEIEEEPDAVDAGSPENSP